MLHQPLAPLDFTLHWSIHDLFRMWTPTSSAPNRQPYLYGTEHQTRAAMPCDKSCAMVSLCSLHSRAFRTQLLSFAGPFLPGLCPRKLGPVGCPPEDCTRPGDHCTISTTCPAFFLHCTECVPLLQLPPDASPGRCCALFLNCMASPFTHVPAQTLYAAAYNVVFYMGLGLLAFKNPMDTWVEVKKVFWRLMKAGWKLWPLVHCFTYTVIPTSHKVRPTLLPVSPPPPPPIPLGQESVCCMLGVRRSHINPSPY